MAHQASQQAAENYAARDRREKRDAPGFEVEG